MALELQELSVEPNFDVTITGFETAEADILIGELEESAARFDTLRLKFGLQCADGQIRLLCNPHHNESPGLFPRNGTPAPAHPTGRHAACPAVTLAPLDSVFNFRIVEFPVLTDF